MEKILYLGSKSGTSGDRLSALKRLGYEVRQIDPRDLLPRTKLIDKMTWTVGPGHLAKWVSGRISKDALSFHSDITWIDSGEYVHPDLLADLKNSGSKIVAFNHDDPFGSRDGCRFDTFLRGVPLHDLTLVFRRPNLQEAIQAGAKTVYLTYMTCDEITHTPSNAQLAAEKFPLIFVGTWMPGRGEFLSKLIEQRLPISIYGARWRKSRHWNKIGPHFKGDHLNGDQYTTAIVQHSIAIGLLSKGNRDLHTTRSMEIPWMSTILCAERTADHLDLYEDTVEAAFWSDAAECAEICVKLLKDKGKLEKMSVAGRRRASVNGFTNQRLVRQALNLILRSEVEYELRLKEEIVTK